MYAAGLLGQRFFKRKFKMADEVSQSTDSSVPDEGSFNNFIGPYATCTSPTVHLIVCLTVVTLMLIATFGPRNAGLHQVIVSIY